MNGCMMSKLLFFSWAFTREAEKLLREHHIYWSTRADLDALIQLTGLRALPEYNV